MEVIKAWNFLRGYVIIEVKGLTLERLLNLAATRDIYLWDINRVEYTVLEMKVSIPGFKALNSIIDKVGCRVEMLAEKGLPFIVHRLKKRKMLVFGLFIFLAIIITLSSLIWNIEIIGNERIEGEDILRVLEMENIKKGIMKYRIDKDYIKYVLLNEFDEIAFLSLEFKGMKLIVELKEQDLPPEKIDTDIPCNIIAARKGIITKMIVRNGNALVRKGDIVQEGQILIEGQILDEESELRILVHADGEILAKTIYSCRVNEPIIKTIAEETGEIYEKKEIRLGDKGIQFSKGEIPFEDYKETTREVKLIDIDIDLPIKIFVHEYRELRNETIEQNIDFLKQSTYIKAIEELNRQLPEDVQLESKDVKYSIDNDILSAYVRVEAIEEIGEKEIINGEKREDEAW